MAGEEARDRVVCLVAVGAQTRIQFNVSRIRLSACHCCLVAVGAQTFSHVMGGRRRPRAVVRALVAVGAQIFSHDGGEEKATRLSAALYHDQVAPSLQRASPLLHLRLARL